MYLVMIPNMQRPQQILQVQVALRMRSSCSLLRRSAASTCRHLKHVKTHKGILSPAGLWIQILKGAFEWSMQPG